MTRTKYQYQIIRFIPDRVSEEFVNVGVVMYVPEQRFLKARVIDRYSRITQFFEHVDGAYLRKTLKFIASRIATRAQQLNTELEFEHPASLESFTSAILPKDDSALMFSEINRGLDLDAEKVFTHLVERYLAEEKPTEHRYTDKEVWSKIYRKYFEKQGIADKLQKRTINTGTDRLAFDLAYKNGNWNYLEPVSFDLKTIDAFREKVFKLIGKADALGTSEEKADYHILTHLSSNRPQLQAYLVQKLNGRQLGNARVNLVSESDLEDFLAKVERDMVHQP